MADSANSGRFPARAGYLRELWQRRIPAGCRSRDERQAFWPCQRFPMRGLRSPRLARRSPPAARQEDLTGINFKSIVRWRPSGPLSRNRSPATEGGLGNSRRDGLRSRRLLIVLPVLRTCDLARRGADQMDPPAGRTGDCFKIREPRLDHSRTLNFLSCGRTREEKITHRIMMQRRPRANLDLHQLSPIRPLQVPTANR